MSNYKPVFFDIETTGFNPTIPKWWNNKIPSEVTAVAVGQIKDWTEDGEDRELDVFLNEGNEEYELIEEVRNYMEGIDAEYSDRGWVPFLVGHNIIQYDVMYWSARAARYRQDPWPISDGWRRLDTMRALELPADAEGGGSIYPGQQDYADYLGLDYVDRLDGGDMPEAFVNEEYEEIAIHVEDDVSTLMDIFMEEREDMVDEFWGHYDKHHDNSLTEDKPVFGENVDIDVGGDE